MPVIGETGFGLQISGVEPQVSVAFLLLSPASATYPLGPCTVIQPDVSMPLQISTPQYTLPVALPCEATFTGVTVRAQWVLTGVSQGAIPGLPGVALSNALEITFGS